MVVEEPILQKKVKPEMPKIDISEEDVAGFNALRELTLRQKAKEIELENDGNEFIPAYFCTKEEEEESIKEEEGSGRAGDVSAEENDINSSNSSSRLLLFEKLASVSTDFSYENALKRSDSSACNLVVASKAEENKSEPKVEE
mmetsp:Transcript_72300/g.83997  ORF Transcript_72300/g.83997 Transcript_72300/m.83997 type:complete len:143 (-) Transcript_72300:211-639(-)